MKLAFFFEIKRCVTFCDFQSELSWEELQSNSVPPEVHIRRATAPYDKKLHNLWGFFILIGIKMCESGT